MRVLVLDGNENQAVASVRSLSGAGHNVFVGADSSWSKAGWSRFCRGSFRYAPPQEDAAAFIERIVKEVKRESGALVLPMTERTTLPLSTEREKIFAAGGRLVLPPHETVLRAFDKQQTTRLAESLGIIVPHTTLISDREQARTLAASSTYPLVLKARSSEEVSEEGKVQATGAPLYARDAQEFLTGYDELRRRCSSVLAQEFIEGAGAGYFALMRDGELRAEFAHRRIRDVRPTGSGSSVRESVVPAPQLREAALSILRELRWHGVAMVEFRVRADGAPVFLEVNGRFWNSLPLAVYAGADFPALLAQMAERGETKAVLDYRKGVRCRWLLGDFRHLLEVWKGAPAGFPGEFPKRLRTLLDFLTPVKGTFHDNFMWRDPLPELGDWLDFAFRRLPARLGKSSTARKDVNVQRGYSLP
ncbi:MAG: hypothetical protein QOJ02_2901 [Acidobacteriota bacterium]|jgi:predicted ATP-grasp superfamily ATP-dependent carboligase|nr:hypothetical protein [Acidobacteriota bacterium]